MRNKGEKPNLIILSPAKLNLCLFILGKRKDGYHDIISLVSKISLYDEIEISLLEDDGRAGEKKDEIIFTPRWDIPERNTVSATVDELRKILSIRRVRIEVRKKIPPGSGLGGASSNSASCIKAFLGIKNKKKDEVLRIAEKIGADVPLFLSTSPCIIEGKGERITELEIKGIEKMYFVVVWDRIVSKTSYVYSSFDELSKIPDFRRKGKVQEKRNKLISYLRSLALKKEGGIDELSELIGFNDLEEAFLNTYPEARKLKRELERFGRFFLTGSGSAFFSVHKRREDAEQLAEKLSKFFKHVFVVNHVR